MPKATIRLHPGLRVGAVPARLFGSFVEHMGRCLYTGIYEPGHPTADADDFRGDVLALVRELGVTTVRYPGGNFVSGYRWEDGVGPVDERQARLELAWHSVETNEVGLNEFMRWVAKAGVEPMLALNLGTRGVEDAVRLLEYANHPGGTELSELRRAHGEDRPHDIRMWCLGNEMDGPWQIGHKTAAEYGRLAAETARAMRMLDPGLELVVCGSSSASMRTFGDWESEVLEHTIDLVDHISLHAYYEPFGDDVDSFLASGAAMDRFIEDVAAIADAVAARRGVRKRIGLSFDEWNVWKERSKRAPGPPSEWVRAPAFAEEEYDVTDAVVVGGLLISLLRHVDRVSAACLSLLTNVSAPIRTVAGGAAWRQTIFHPFALAAAHARGTVLQVALDAPTITTDRHGDVPMVDAVATTTGDELALFVVNRHRTESVDVQADLAAFGVEGLLDARSVYDDDPSAVNTAEHPDRVVPRPLKAGVDGGVLRATVPPESFSVLRLAVS
ncbi:alpha-N-arabinofuranosidase [Kribbella sp. VKM Ac-2527]|uniref:non-reducing end alpha-L-arabinofuranosidase n=1 Tax=Kribbella caucasensis TaxID=2512215 RepID=A0A4R6J5Z3_9ACTN|nr:alpha-N-arabinofuranosidase [Kribbella sp. VKM Ac-2527]TDO29675.1 alpha-N-arabinofuranosidase [Kribbella sp. VKM Ac-2527]